jgi:signal transduction histidine kinase
MLRLVDDILALQSLESGGMRFTRETVDVRTVAAHAVEANEALARKYDVAVLLESAAEPALATADPVRAGQVIGNLLSNAVKFSPPGHPVRVDVRAVGDMIRTSVADAGPGIPEEAREMIFERFQQLDGASTRERDGSGLGLAISRAMTERLDGVLDFESVVGEGTTFYLDLPAADA